MAVRFPDPIHPVDPIELEINQLFDHLIVCLNQRRETLLTTYRETRAQIAAIPIARARKEQELIAFKIQTEQSFQMNELRETQERILAEIEQTLSEVRVPQLETRAVFRSNCGHLEQVITGVGEVVEEEVPVVPQGVPVVPRYEQMRPIVTVGKRGVAPGELWNPNGIAVDENTNLIYIAEGEDSHRVSIFSETGEFINTFTHRDMIVPHGIAIHRDNLYLTDTGLHAVFQFQIEVNMRLVAKLGSKGSGMGQFNCPHGLTVSTNGHVFVADHDNNRIKILDDSLHFQREITHQTMEHPFDVKLTSDEVYVLCRVSPCILVFSYTGEKIRQLLTRGPGMQIRLTNFFCLDRKQNLLFSDWWTNEVRVFSKEATQLRTIGEPGHEVGMFDRPQGIILTKNFKFSLLLNNQKTIFQFTVEPANNGHPRDWSKMAVMYRYPL